MDSAATGIATGRSSPARTTCWDMGNRSNYEKVSPRGLLRCGRRYRARGSSEQTYLHEVCQRSLREFVAARPFCSSLSERSGRRSNSLRLRHAARPSLGPCEFVPVPYSVAGVTAERVISEPGVAGAVSTGASCGQISRLVWHFRSCRGIRKRQTMFPKSEIIRRIADPHTP